MPNGPFTPEQIAQILEEFFKTVGTRQYVGARYVPIFGRKGEDSIEWDNTGTYEPLSVVLYQGNSYTSRQFVPVGVEITNQEFWAVTGNYNAQVEQYRRETAAAAEAAAAAAEAAEAAQSDIDKLLPKADFTEENTVKNYIDNTVDNLNTSIHEYVESLADRFVDFSYNDVSFVGENGKTTLVHYATVPSNYKPKLIIANDTVNTVEHDIDAAFRTKASLLVNAGVFDTTTKLTEGVVIADGIVRKNTVTSLEDRSTIYMTKEGVLNYAPSSMTGDEIADAYDPEWAVTAFYPFIENGVFTQNERSHYDYQPRTCIAQDYDGNYCVFANAGRRAENEGLTIYDMRDFLDQIGFNAKFAYSLDGGASSSLSVMGARTNSLTDNNHRAVANFIGFFEKDAVNPDVFYASRAISQFVIRNSMTKNRIYATQFEQFVKDHANVSNSIFDIEMGEEGRTYTPVVTQAFQQSNGLWRLLTRAQGDSQLTPAIQLNTHSQDALFFNKRPANKEYVRYLSWAGHGKDTSHAILSNTPMIKYLAIFQQGGNNFVVPFYRYNFNDVAGEPNMPAYAVAPDGTNTKFTLTMDFTNNTLTWTHDNTGTAINLMTLIGVDWMF